MTIPTGVASESDRYEAVLVSRALPWNRYPKFETEQEAVAFAAMKNLETL